MNRVYKVIWSKAKHCYVVTSEIAKSHTKGESTGRGLKKLAAALLVAAALMGPNFAWAADGTAIVKDTSGVEQTVYTQKGAEDNFATKTDLDAKANAADVANTYVNKTNAEVTFLTVSGDVEAHGNLKVGNGNFTVYGNTGNVTTGSAAIGGALTVDGDTEIGGDLGVTGNLFAGGYTETDAKAALNADGSIKGANGDFEVDENGKVMAKGGVETGGAEIKTGGGSITAGKITGTELNTQGGAITGGMATVTGLTTQGGDISGGTITATGLNTQGGEINGGDIKSSGTIHADDKISGNGLDARSGAISGGSLSVTGTMEGNSLKLNGGNLDAGSGTITTTGNIKADGTITTNNLAVTGGLETDHITLGSEPLNYTKIDKGNVTSKILATDGGVIPIAESIFNKDGSSITVRTNEGSVDSTGNSTVGGKEISQYLGDNAKPEGSQKNVTRKMVRNNDGTFSMEDKAVVEGKSSTVSQNAEERKVTVIDGNNKASTNLSNNGFNTFASDGTNKTYTKQTATDIKNTAEKGMISHTAKNLVNRAYENMTNTVDKDLTTTVGGEMKTTVTGKVTEDYKANLTTTVEGQATENFNKGLDTNITGDENHTATGTITNTAQTVKTITGNNTVISNNGGTTFANKEAKTPFAEGGETGTRVNTKITGNKVETGKVLTDFAEVANNLDVKGSTTLGRDGNTTLTVKSKSTFRDTVKMDSTLEVDGTSKFNDKVTITQNGLAVTGGTTTDTLKVEKTSEFGGKAAFKDDVSMGKNLSVGGNLNVDGNIETHDAELSETSRQVVTGRQLYQTNERVDRLDNRIKKVGANAAALAALRPGDFNPDDKFSIAAGFGSYRNANAAALGLFYRPNENVLLSLGTSFGDGENMVNAGVSVKFGRGKSMAERRKEMADEVSSMRDEMRSQDERIAELEEMLKKQSELIEKLSKES